MPTVTKIPNPFLSTAETSAVPSIGAGHGLNVGHGHTKLVIIDSDGTVRNRVVFPSQIAPAGAQVEGGGNRALRVPAAGREWWVGDDAELSDVQFTMHSQDRLSDASFIPALVRAAYLRCTDLDAMQPNAVCVSGLPATWASSLERCKALGARIVEGSPITFVRRRVIPEPVALMYALKYDNFGQVIDPRFDLDTIGVADAGQVTFDLAEVRRGEVVADRLRTDSRYGIAAALNKVRNILSDAFERDLSLWETDLAIRNRKLQVAGRWRDLPDGWDAPLVRQAEGMVNWMREIWKSGAQLSAIVLGGGGAELEMIADRAQRAFPHLTVAPEPQIAIALGYARFARALAAKEAAKA